MSFVDGSSFSCREACLPVDEGATRYGGLEKDSKKKTSKAVFPVFVLISISEGMTVNVMKVFYLNLGVSLLLIVGGFFVPPIGVIDGSVLTAVGLLLMFGVIAQIPTILDAVQKGKSIRLQKGDVSVDISAKTEAPSLDNAREPQH